MGGAVSSGESNDELIDNLKEAEYIKTPSVEQIFRAVDRGFYYTKNNRQNPYKDSAWKYGNLHLSAPCIYSEVLENLKLEPGQSFLNIGSGTGYLSTMAGLIIGRNGINHGIELHEDVVEYARHKLYRFTKTTAAVDLYEFCEPEFVVGNCMDAVTTPGRYDRIYCGAACPKPYLTAIIELLKVGGILVVPVQDSLQQITRTSETQVDSKNLLNVSFATLVEGGRNKDKGTVRLPEWNPLKLSEICRANIRAAIRKNCVRIETEPPKRSSTPKNGIENSSNGGITRPRRQDRRFERGSCIFTRIQGGSRTDENGRRPPGIVSIAYAIPDESSSDLSTVSDNDAAEEGNDDVNSSSVSVASSMKDKETEQEKKNGQDHDEESNDVDAEMKDVSETFTKKKRTELHDGNMEEGVPKATYSGSSSNGNSNKKKKSEKVDDQVEEEPTDDTDDSNEPFPFRRRRATPTSPTTTPAISVSSSSSSPAQPPQSSASNEQDSNHPPSTSFSCTMSSVFEAFMRAAERRRLHHSRNNTNNSSSSSRNSRRLIRDSSPPVIGLNATTTTTSTTTTPANNSSGRGDEDEDTNNNSGGGAGESSNNSHLFNWSLTSSANNSNNNLSNVSSTDPDGQENNDAPNDNINNQTRVKTTTTPSSSSTSSLTATLMDSSNHEDDDDDQLMSENITEPKTENIASQNDPSSSTFVHEHDQNHSKSKNTKNNDANADGDQNVPRSVHGKKVSSTSKLSSSLPSRNPFDESRSSSNDDHHARSSSSHEEEDEDDDEEDEDRKNYTRRRTQSENMEIRNELVFLNLPDDIGDDSDDSDGSRDGHRASTTETIPDLQEEYVNEPYQPVTHEFFIQMRDRIKTLPLPPAILVYLNYDRSL